MHRCEFADKIPRIMRAARCQFHQHFKCSFVPIFLRQKSIKLNFKYKKNFRMRKLLIQWWWNWHIRSLSICQGHLFFNISCKIENVFLNLAWSFSKMIQNQITFWFQIHRLLYRPEQSWASPFRSGSFWSLPSSLSLSAAAVQTVVQVRSDPDVQSSWRIWLYLLIKLDSILFTVLQSTTLFNFMSQNMAMPKICGSRY